MKDYRVLVEALLAQPIKVVEVDTPQAQLHFDRLKDGTWRLTITRGLIEEVM